MAEYDIDSLVRDPDFQRRPFEERRAILKEADAEGFGTLDNGSQTRMLAEMKQQPWWGGASKTAQRPALAISGTQQDVMGIASPRQRKEAQEVKGPLVKTLAETGGMAVGGTLGGVLGAGAGYMAGKRVGQYAAGETPDTGYFNAAKDVGLGSLMQVGGNLIGKGASKLVPQGAIDKLYASSLKLSTSPSVLSIPERNAIITTGLKEKAVPNIKGYERILDKIDGFNNQVETLIANSKGMVSSRDVAARLDDLLAKGDRVAKVDPQFKSIVEGVKAELLDGPDAIPVQQAQEMKRHIYKVYKDAYGIDDATAAKVQGKKQVARGLKEEIEVLHPEVKGLNLQEGELLNFLDPFGRAVARVQNRDIVGLGMQTAPLAGEALAPGSSIAGRVAASAKLIDTPAIKARLAILLNTYKKSGTGAVRRLIGKSAAPAAIATSNRKKSEQ